MQYFTLLITLLKAGALNLPKILTFLYGLLDLLEKAGVTPGNPAGAATLPPFAGSSGLGLLAGKSVGLTTGVGNPTSLGSPLAAQNLEYVEFHAAMESALAESLQQALSIPGQPITQLAFDGSRLRRLVEVLGPMLPAILALIKMMSGM